MGFALAEALAKKGAHVHLVHGPTAVKAVNPQITTYSVQSALDMLEAVQSIWSTMDWGIFAAAVADYRPKKTVDQKIKKTSENLVIELEENPDILSWAANNKGEQLVVGFALETQNGLTYAQDKLKRKKLDAIVLNEMGAPGVGFGGDTNSVKLIFKNNIIRSFELESKATLADKLIIELMNFNHD